MCLNKRTAVFLMCFVFLAVCPSAALADLVGTTLVEGVLWDINPVTGAGTNPRPMGVNDVIGIALGPDGMLYGVTSFGPTLGNPNSLYKIDRLTGLASFIGSTGFSFIGEGDVAFDPTTGIMYACCGGPSSNQLDMFTVNTSTGAGTLVGSLGANRDIGQGLVFDSAGQLYALDSTSEEIKKINKANAATISAVALSVAMGNRGALARDPITNVYYEVDGGVAGNNTLYKLDPATGIMTALGPVPPSGGFSGLTWVPPVPEPSTLILAFLGIAAAAMPRRPFRHYRPMLHAVK